MPGQTRREGVLCLVLPFSFSQDVWARMGESFSQPRAVVPDAYVLDLSSL
jgi:hypothetical protein